MIVKRIGCTTIHKKRYINASYIHSFKIIHLLSKIQQQSMHKITSTVDTIYTYHSFFSAAFKQIQIALDCPLQVITATNF